MIGQHQISVNGLKTWLGGGYNVWSNAQNENFCWRKHSTAKHKSSSFLHQSETMSGQKARYDDNQDVAMEYNVFVLSIVHKPNVVYEFRRKE